MKQLHGGQSVRCGWLQLSLLATRSGSSSAPCRENNLLALPAQEPVQPRRHARFSRLPFRWRRRSTERRTGTDPQQAWKFVTEWRRRLRLRLASSRYAVHNLQPRHEPGPASPLGPPAASVRHLHLLTDSVLLHPIALVFADPLFRLQSVPSSLPDEFTFVFFPNKVSSDDQELVVDRRRQVRSICSCRCHVTAQCDVTATHSVAQKSTKVAVILSRLGTTYKSFILWPRRAMFCRAHISNVSM